MLGQELMLAKIDSVQGTEFNVWLPPGNWFDFHNDSLLKGGKIILYKTGAEPPVFVKQGSIIPMYNEPTGTNIMHDDSLTLHVYPGKNASFELFEGEFSPNTTNSNNYRTTRIDFNQAAYTLTIAGVKGNYKKGATQRRYKIEFHGSPKPFNVQVNGMPLKYLSNSNSGVDKGVLWDSKRKVLIVLISKTNVNAKLTIKKLKN
jgi:alpha-D-xyloside xylohydrolase